MFIFFLLPSSIYFFTDVLLKKGRKTQTNLFLPSISKVLVLKTIINLKFIMFYREKAFL